MENQPEVVTAPPQDPPAGTLVVQEGALSEKFVESSGKQIELRARLLAMALKALKPHDIQDFDGKPYIEGEGAARIMSVIRGFKVGEAKFNVENIHPHYFVECQIPIEFLGATTVALGDCSTADPFFTGKDGQSGQYKRHLDRTGSEAMAGRLILGDAKKKARENALSRGVSELLGLKGLSWDDLGKLGFDRAGAGSNVSFKKGSQGGEVKTVTVSEAKAMATGSKCNITGEFVKTGTRKAGEKTITIVEIKDAQNVLDIQVWGEVQVGALAGQAVFCEGVLINEFRGAKQYTAVKIDLADRGGDSNDSTGK